MYKISNSYILIKSNLPAEERKKYLHIKRKLVNFKTQALFSKNKKNLNDINEKVKRLKDELRQIGQEEGHSLDLDNFELPQHSEVDCADQWIGTLNIGNGDFRQVNCSGNLLTELKVGANVEELICTRNHFLQNLDLSDAVKLKKLECKHCELEEIIIPESLEYLEADITALPDINTMKSLKNERLEVFVSVHKSIH